jgi:hypothetical protein
VLELPHALAGATIATKITNPFLALPLAFLSNFILDLFPHWNPNLTSEMKTYGKLTKKTKIIIFADSFLALIIGLFIAFRFWPNWQKTVLVITSCFLAVLADLAEAPYFLLGYNHPFIQKLARFQGSLQFRASFFPGIISQVIFVIACLFSILT